MEERDLRLQKVKEAIGLFRLTDRLHHKRCELAFADLHMHRSLHMALIYIAHHADASQKELAEEFGISDPAIAKTLKKLEQDGMIVRVPSENDARQNCLSLTEKGRRVMEETHRISECIEGEMLSDCSEAELDALTRGLSKMASALQARIEEERKDGMTDNAKNKT